MTLVVGLTGGIGSGKSTAARMFADYGVDIIDTDVLARDLVTADKPHLKKIVQHFGRGILNADGALNRAQLRRMIFEHPAKRRWLEQLLHPLIWQEAAKQIAAATSPYAIVVVPLLAEKKMHPLIQRVLVITTPPDEQIRRTQQRDQLTVTEIKKILSQQATPEARSAIADDVINNDGALADLRRQVKKLHKLYLNLSHAKKAQ